MLLLTVLLLAHAGFIGAHEKAWNGFTTPGPLVTTFTPYYVPLGAKSYDSTSPLISYKGIWSDQYSSGFVGNSLRTTTQPGAEVSFTFNGTGIEWFGSICKTCGLAIVKIDGKPQGEVNNYCENDRPSKQQRLFWKYDLPSGMHTIKLINTGERARSIRSTGDTAMNLDAFVVTRGVGGGNSTQVSRNVGQWALTQRGSTGVNAMQLAIISQTHALIVDKVEHNPLTIDNHPAWAALYNLDNHSVKPLRMRSNSFCAGGSFLSNGTLINVGGNPVIESRTSAADFGDFNGLQAIRLFQPCDLPNVNDCEMYENHARIQMASPRWYNTVVRLSDGSAMIIGGSKKGGWINNATVNNPTVEYYPPKSIAGSDGILHLSFLEQTLNSNLFAIAFVLPDGQVFMAANRDAIIYDWTSNRERYLPQIPNGVRVTYPMTGTGLLLPLGPKNNYTPEILLCGGSTVDDRQPSSEISSQHPASAQCSRIVLTEEGIKAGWTVEQMPQARVMPDAVLLPTGQVLIVNGGGTGIAGYGNVRNQVGVSNADNPVLTPILYDPNAQAGSRFSSDGLPTSAIPRLYHSVATLTPKGNIMIAGSNPNLDRSEVRYGTEYRVEWLDPPYMSHQRPEILQAPTSIGFRKTFQLQVLIPDRNWREIQGKFVFSISLQLNLIS